jgi:hypothetical protein
MVQVPGGRARTEQAEVIRASAPGHPLGSREAARGCASRLSHHTLGGLQTGAAEPADTSAQPPGDFGWLALQRERLVLPRQAMPGSPNIVRYPWAP